ncbi:MAG: class I SAM-dependent methyltransferase [Tissierellia bacterium]|nr:class I SAM-dependent methyltransferase [Tissierellia bacterium]
MKFYQDIANIYHRLFPLNLKKIDFLEKAAPGKQILDVACGDGRDMLALTQRGFDVIGIDMEQDMVTSARENGANAHVGNMLKIIDQRKYDLIYCVGNSICHLENIGEVKKAFKQAYFHLKDGGKYVLQFINYHPFLKNEDDFLGELPLITDDELIFKRQYFRSHGKIRFHTEIQGDFDPIINDILLIPLMEDDARKLLQDVGFKNIKSYCGFSDEKFKDDAYAVVLLGEK